MSVQISEWTGRFGNNILQVKNALHIALYYNLDVTMPKHPLLPKEARIREVAGEGIRYKGTFFGDLGEISARHGFARDVFTRNADAVIKELRGLLAFSGVEPADPNDLHIHIRSGDIFQNWFPNELARHYTPPPLLFYVSIIRAKPWRNIYIICEDQKNPCLWALRQAYPRAKWREQSLLEDIRLILSARNMVYGGGSFIPALLLFSDNIQSTYTISYGMEPATSSFTKHIRRRVFKGDEYLQLMRSWTNHPIQHRLMLSYGFAPPPRGLRKRRHPGSSLMFQGR